MWPLLIPPPQRLRKELSGLGNIFDNIINIGEAHYIEDLFQFRKQAGDLDITAFFSHFLDKTHKYAEPRGRDIGELCAINDDTIITAINLALHCLIELRRGMSIEIALQGEDCQLCLRRF